MVGVLEQVVEADKLDALDKAARLQGLETLK